MAQSGEKLFYLCIAREGPLSIIIMPQPLSLIRKELLSTFNFMQTSPHQRKMKWGGYIYTWGIMELYNF